MLTFAVVRLQLASSQRTADVKAAMSAETGPSSTATQPGLAEGTAGNVRKSQQIRALHSPHGSADKPGHSALHDELVNGLLETIHRLPAQGPITQFVHHNTLHAYMDQPFWQAVRQVRKGSEVKTLPSEADARAAWQQGRLDPLDLALALGLPSPPCADGQLTAASLRWIAVQWGLPAVARERISWWLRTGKALAALTEGLPAAALALAPDASALAHHLKATARALQLLPAQPEWDGPALAVPHVGEEDRVWQVILAAWLDEGMAALTMEGSSRALHVVGARLLHEAGLWRLLKVPRSVLAHWEHDRPNGLKALEQVLQHLVSADPLQTAQAALLARPGWSGQLVLAAARRHPQDAEEARLQAAAGVAALRLALCGSELDPAEHRAAHAPSVTAWRLLRAALAWHMPIEQLARLPQEALLALRRGLVELDGGDLLCALQQARELHHARVSLGALAANSRRPLEIRQPPRPWAQVLTCIDDREEGLRRHLEELDGELETLGIAGFFNAAMAWRGLDDATASSRCPVVLQPQFAVDEVAAPGHEAAVMRRRRLRGWYARLRLGLHQRGRGSLYGVASLAVAGLFDGVRWMAAAVLPDVATDWRQSALAKLMPPPATTLQVHTMEGKPATAADGAAVVAAVLKTVGLQGRLAQIVLLLGHRAESANNPHRSAYGCGACGGSPGGPNARLVARWANDPEVRRLLALQDIHIPQETWFAAAEHETTGDVIAHYDTADLPEPILPLWQRLQRTLEEACGRSAVERCRKFELAPIDSLPAAAIAHMHRRTVDPLEPRPELNHATNALCIVGPRSLTRSLFLDRRAFLASYDPALDSDGVVLAQVLNAVVPVCGGINLEYFFSRNDPATFGAGTKLPHNPVAGLAVQDGTAGDLRTGLPIQMTELHEPLRLLLIVAAPPERLAEVLRLHPGLKRWIAGGWVRTATLDGSTGQWQAAADPRDIPSVDSTMPPGSTADSLAWVRGHREFLDPALLVPQAVHPMRGAVGSCSQALGTPAGPVAEQQSKTALEPATTLGIGALGSAPIEVA